jgi:hypothetical protein
LSSKLWTRSGLFLSSSIPRSVTTKCDRRVRLRAPAFEVSLSPVHPVGQDRLLTAGQKEFSILLGQAELVCQSGYCVVDVLYLSRRRRRPVAIS